MVITIMIMMRAVVRQSRVIVISAFGCLWKLVSRRLIVGLVLWVRRCVVPVQFVTMNGLMNTAISRLTTGISVSVTKIMSSSRKALT